MSYTFAVITKVPKHNEEGNKYDDIFIRNRAKEEDAITVANACGYQSFRPCEDEEVNSIPSEDIIDVSLPVFHLGEILIFDGTGREVGGLQRKPSKWSVEVAEYNDLDEAIDCAQRVLLWNN